MSYYSLPPCPSDARNLTISAILSKLDSACQQGDLSVPGVFVEHSSQFDTPVPASHFYSLSAPFLESLGFRTVMMMKALSGIDDTTESIVKRIDLIIADEDQYELDEKSPSQQTIQAARKLLRSMADVGYNNLPKTYVSIYYGEITVTWKTERRSCCASHFVRMEALSYIVSQTTVISARRIYSSDG